MGKNQYIPFYWKKAQGMQNTFTLLLVSWYVLGKPSVYVCNSEIYIMYTEYERESYLLWYRNQS